MQDRFLIRRENYSIDTDPGRLQVDVIQDFLANHLYWAQGRSKEMVEKSIANSLCFGYTTGQHRLALPA